MQEDQAETITQQPESILPRGNPPLSPTLRKKTKLIFSLSQLLEHFDESAFTTTQPRQRAHINLVTAGTTTTIGQLVQESAAGRTLTV